MSLLRHFEASGDERAAYLQMRRAVTGEDTELQGEAEEGMSDAAPLAQARYAEMSAAEQFVLTVSANGYGKRTSSFEYRLTGRGGKGITAMAVNDRNGPLVASFPVEQGDQVMLVTGTGQVIRCGVDDIRIAGRSTQGVIVFRLDGEEVVSVEHLSDVGAEDETGDNGESGAEPEGDPPAGEV
jgi:DNA gyrase subunit A